MLTDAQILADVPTFLSIESMLKATPAYESGKRFIYMEASNEARDIQNERVLAKALEASAAYYTKFGNIDIDHLSLLGKPNPKTGYIGIPNPELYEIGQPVQVRVEGAKTFVKAELYSGNGPTAENANMVWESMTSQQPPKRWYPSVGGVPLTKSIHIDPKSGDKMAVIEAVRWTNIGLSQTPVNPDLPVATTVPFGVLAKAMTASGALMVKALTAGYGTDSAGLDGGAALRKQSLDRRIQSYWQFREQCAKALTEGSIGANPGRHAMAAWAVTQFGLSHDEAAEYVERFMRDLSQAKRSKQ